MRDSGGLFLVAGHADAARVAVLGLHGMQHRGGSGAALTVADGMRLRSVSGRGSVAEVLSEEVGALLGTVAVGTVWSGDGTDRLVSGGFRGGRVVAGVVGRFTNANSLRQELLGQGAMLRSGSDAELLVHLVARSTQRTLVNRLVDAVWRLEGAYVLALCTPDRLVVLRDPAGFRPVWIGHLGDAALVSTDDAALAEVGARPGRALAPGEMLIIDEQGTVGIKPLPERAQARCSQEMIGLASAHGSPFGISAHRIRVQLGEVLAAHHPAPEATVVVGMPGAGEAIAVGMARALGLPQERGLEVVEPGPFGVASDGLDYGSPTRLRVVASAVEEQRVLLVTAWIGAGDRIRQAIARLQAAGATAVDLRCAAPPMRLACPYGVTMPGTETLASARHPDAADLASWLGADSASWLAGPTLDPVLGPRDGRCEACLTGVLPVDVQDALDEDQLSLFG